MMNIDTRARKEESGRIPRDYIESLNKKYE